MNYKTYHFDQYNIYTIKTDRFKNGYMEVCFKEDVDHVNLSQRNLLSHLLVYTSKKYPTKRELMIARENIYTPFITANVSRTGKNLFSYFTLDFIHPKYIKEKNYLENSLAFFFEILMRPNVVDGKWDPQSFQLIKEQLHISMEQYKERPVSYAIVESKKRLFKNHLLGQRMIGTHEELEQVTLESIYEEHQHLMNDTMCDILLIGDFDMDHVVSLIKKLFQKPVVAKKEICPIITFDLPTFKKEIAQGPYNQTQLIVYYKIDELSDWERNFTANIFFRLLGSSSGMNDKLTNYLRVQNSLCYYCGSRPSVRDSLYVINVGLSLSHVTEAEKWIFKAVDEMAKGIITEEELEIQKSKFLADLRLQEDNIYGLIEDYYFHETMNRATIEEFVQEIPKVTIEDIKKFGQKLHKIYEFVLEEAQDENNSI